MKINHIFYSLSSYEVYATFKKDFLEFDFNIPLSSSYLKNAIGYKKDMTVDMKRVIKMVHTAETANKSMLLMAKMKFGYKNKDFPEIKREALPYSENTKYLLAKEYVGLLESSDTRKGANDSLIIGDKIYIPTEHAFENNLFSERLLLPVLAETNR